PSSPLISLTTITHSQLRRTASALLSHPPSRSPCYHHLLVRGSKRARENVAASLLNLVKSDEDKVAGDIRKVDGAKATVRALIGNNSKVRAREKCKVEVLL
ncbi:unnamed protein product, partial [Musa banksii]